MRVKIGPLRGNDDLARALEARLAGQAGVQAAEANAATGSLLVLYDPEAPGWRDPGAVPGLPCRRCRWPICSPTCRPS